jgi:hypothetical protein
MKCSPGRVSTEFRRHGIPRNFLTFEVISAQFRRNSAKFRGIPRNFAGIEPEITSVFRGMPKCHFRGHPIPRSSLLTGGGRGGGRSESYDDEKALSSINHSLLSVSILLELLWKHTAMWERTLTRDSVMSQPIGLAGDMI